MKLDDYIAALQALRAEHGNLDVETDGYGFGQRQSATMPSIGYAKILKGREYKPAWWHEYLDDDRKGEARVRL